MHNVNCKRCNKELFVADILYQDSTLVKAEVTGRNRRGAMFKNITVFFVNTDGDMVVKCKGCGNVNAIPFPVNEFDKTEPKKNLVEL